jgi:L-threonylcarbamoyladenylate synthase
MLNQMKKVLKVNPEQPSSRIIAAAADIITKGGIIAFPTRCLYGLGAAAFNPAAVDRLFVIKRRPVQKPILVLIGNAVQLDGLVKTIPRTAARLMAHFWPGRVTLVFQASSTVPVNLTAGTGKIGIRMPGSAVASALVGAVQGPITGTSANLSGRPGCYQIADLEPEIAGQLDLILDAGMLRGGKGSTVVDVTGDVPCIIREGEVSAEKILALVAE